MKAARRGRKGKERKRGRTSGLKGVECVRPLPRQTLIPGREVEPLVGGGGGREGEEGGG